MDFRTDRLTAERLAWGHLDELAALHLDPEVSRHLGGVRSVEHTRAYLETNLAHWDEYGYGLWVVRTTDGAFAGRAGVRRTEVEGAPEVEIAYTFRRDLWGRGLATEVCRALVAIWRERLISPSLVGIVSLENRASRRVLEKIGFGYEREGVYHDAPVALYRLGPEQRRPQS